MPHIWRSADGFSDLRADFFGRPEERNALDLTTAYIMIVGTVLVVIFLLFNFSIAVVFMAYGNLREIFRKMMDRDKSNWGNFKVRRSSCCAAWPQVALCECLRCCSGMHPGRLHTR